MTGLQKEFSEGDLAHDLVLVIAVARHICQKQLASSLLTKVLIIQFALTTYFFENFSLDALISVIVYL